MPIFSLFTSKYKRIFLFSRKKKEEICLKLVLNLSYCEVIETLLEEFLKIKKAQQY